MDQVNKARAAAVHDPSAVAAYEAILHALWTLDRKTASRQALRAFAVVPDNLQHASNALTALMYGDRVLDIPNWLHRTPEPVAAAERHEVDLPPLVALYGRLLEETARRRSEGWTPSSIEAVKFDMPLSLEHLANFRRSEVSTGTQTVPERPDDFPSLDFTSLYPEVSEAERERWTTPYWRPARPF